MIFKKSCAILKSRSISIDAKCQFIIMDTKGYLVGILVSSPIEDIHTAFRGNFRGGIIQMVYFLSQQSPMGANQIS